MLSTRWSRLAEAVDDYSRAMKPCLSEDQCALYSEIEREVSWL